MIFSALYFFSYFNIYRSLNTYTQPERNFIKKLIEEIVESNKGSISEINAINLCHDLERRVSINDAENVINNLIQGKWLIRSGDNLHLSVLTTSEMTNYFQDNYSDRCAKCNFCFNITFKVNKKN